MCNVRFIQGVNITGSVEKCFVLYILPTCYYFRQGNYVFGSIGLFVYLSVCLLAIFLKKL